MKKLRKSGGAMNVKTIQKKFELIIRQKKITRIDRLSSENSAMHNYRKPQRKR